MRPDQSTRYRVQLLRSQRFAPEEKGLIELFIREVAAVGAQANTNYFGDLMASLPRRVISQQLCSNPGRRTLQNAILQFESLASQTYEGQQIVAALGITGSVNHGLISVEELWREDFAAVLSNGFDTMYVCGSDGRVFNLLFLSTDASASFAPHRLGAIANWCNNNNRVAIVLNRNGEILVFKGKRLQFAKRRGLWRYYAHDSVVQCIGKGLKKDIRNAVYESCLDVSFARSGGCIAILTKKGAGQIGNHVEPDDLITTGSKTRTKLLSTAVKKPFHKLDRRIRQELLAMDGATVLTHKGELLTAGAIVKVPGGSSGGGRRAATVELSKIGLGIKISADGPITGFRVETEIFSL